MIKIKLAHQPWTSCKKYESEVKWHDTGWRKYPSRRNNASHLVFRGIKVQASLQVWVKKLSFDIQKFSVMNLKETSWTPTDGELTTGIEEKKTAFIRGIGNLFFIFQHEMTYLYLTSNHLENEYYLIKVNIIAVFIKNTEL